MLLCNVILETGEEVDIEKGNQLIREVVDCLRGRGLTATYADFILDKAKLEILRLAKF